MSEWLPIETVPKDGTLVDLWSATYNARLPDCKFVQEEWDEQGHWYQAYSENPSSFHYVSDDDDLTHWMPLPAAPSPFRQGEYVVVAGVDMQADPKWKPDLG